MIFNPVYDVKQLCDQQQQYNIRHGLPLTLRIRMFPTHIGGLQFPVNAW